MFTAVLAQPSSSNGKDNNFPPKCSDDQLLRLLTTTLHNQNDASNNPNNRSNNNNNSISNHSKLVFTQTNSKVIKSVRRKITQRASDGGRMYMVECIVRGKKQFRKATEQQLISRAPLKLIDFMEKFMIYKEKGEPIKYENHD